MTKDQSQAEMRAEFEKWRDEWDGKHAGLGMKAWPSEYEVWQAALASRPTVTNDELLAVLERAREAIAAAAKKTSMQCYLDEYPEPTGNDQKRFYAEMREAEATVNSALAAINEITGGK